MTDELDRTFAALKKASFATVLNAYKREVVRTNDVVIYDDLFKPYGWTHIEFLQALNLWANAGPRMDQA